VCLVSVVKKGHGRKAHGLLSFQAMGIFSMAFFRFFKVALIRFSSGNINLTAKPV